ncbi:heterokaryon incompatibility protein-domain-containing protein, partial [Sordaria brevicollis]
SPSTATSSGSQESLETARLWLSDCLRNHPECRRQSPSQDKPSSSSLPTRLIYVGEKHGQLAPQLILTASSTTSDGTTYLTLSHSWSITMRGNSLKLTTRNIQQLQERIPLESLPRTFQDAMDMTRRLGYQYIWIDSLCIIQDSKEDWEREAITMSDVYGNSTCTIAALGTNAQDCCYGSRNPLSFLPCRISTPSSSIPVYAVDARLSWDFDYVSDKSHSALFHRGWIMQERLLSSRVIYTGQHQLYWECCQHKTNEFFSFAFGLGPTMRQSPKLTFHALCDSRYLPMNRPGLADPLNNSLDCDMLELYSLWASLLESYTQMQLSRQTDRLIALTGIARAVQNNRGWAYAAGIWQEFWPLDLLWHKKFEVDPLEGPKETKYLTQSGLNAPSWSWATTNEPKDFFGNFRRDGMWYETAWWPLKATPKWPPLPKGPRRPVPKSAAESQIRTFYLAQCLVFPSPPSSTQHDTTTSEQMMTLGVKGWVRKETVVRRNGYQGPEWSVMLETQPETDDRSPGMPDFGNLRLSWDEEPTAHEEVYLLTLIFWPTMDVQQHAGLILTPGAYNSFTVSDFRRSRQARRCRSLLQAGGYLLGTPEVG